MATRDSTTQRFAADAAGAAVSHDHDVISAASSSPASSASRLCNSGIASRLCGSSVTNNRTCCIYIPNRHHTHLRRRLSLTAAPRLDHSGCRCHCLAGECNFSSRHWIHTLHPTASARVSHSRATARPAPFDQCN